MTVGSDVLMVGGGQISRTKWTISGGATQRGKLEKKSSIYIIHYFIPIVEELNNEKNISFS